MDQNYYLHSVGISTWISYFFVDIRQYEVHHLSGWEFAVEDGDTGGATPCYDLDCGTKEGIHMETYLETSMEYTPVPYVNAND